MRYNYCKEPLTKKMLADRLYNLNKFSMSLPFLFLCMAGVFVWFVISMIKDVSIYAGIISSVVILLIVVIIWLVTKAQLNAGEKILDFDFDHLRVFGYWNDAEKHFEQFIKECTEGRYYLPYNCCTIDDCCFFGTDNYIVFFDGGIMRLIPAEILLYAYARAYMGRHHTEVEFILVLNDSTKFKVNYNEDTIKSAESFLYNIYGITVGFARDRKRACNRDFYNFQIECEQARAAKKAELAAGTFAPDTDYPYSFSTRETNPRVYAWGKHFFFLSMVFLIFALFTIVSDGITTPFFFLLVIGIIFLCIALFNIL